jgi:transcriptional regulator with XRE-family HTH domain
MSGIAIQRILTARGDGLAAIRRELGLTGAEIERATGLPRGVVSSVEAGRLYAYPRFVERVTAFFAEETGQSAEELRERLFPEGEAVVP